MKVIIAAVVATLVLTTCAVEETQWTPDEAASNRRDTTSMLTKLRAAVKQIEFLADEVDAVLSHTGTDQVADDANWLPANVEMFRRASRRRQSGRRRYDAYGVAGRFGRSAN